MARQDEQLQELLDGMKELIEASNLNQQELNAFKAQVGELQSEIKALTEEITELKAQNELTNCHFRELYKTQSLEELLEKMASIGKDAVHADECKVYGINDEKFSELLGITGGEIAFTVESQTERGMYVPLEDQQGEVIGIVFAKREGKDFNKDDAKVFNLNDGGLGTIFRVSLEQKITENIAVTDKLTKLKNRDGMAEYIREDVLARAQENAPVSAIMFDIDHFKRFNDTYGHDIGDKCLKLVASTLKNNVRGDSGVFRWGGEEMIVILPVNEEKAFEIAERLRQAVKGATLVVDDKTKETTQVTVSGGISEFHPKSIEIDKNRIETAFEVCLKEADTALYRAKENGRDRVYGSDTLMKTHYSLPSPTELFQRWCEKREIPTTTSVYDVIASEAFWESAWEAASAMFRNELEIEEMWAAASAYNTPIKDANKGFAIAVLDEWGRNKDRLDSETYRRLYSDVEAIRAMAYTPELINVKETVLEHEATVDKSVKKDDKGRD